MSEHSNTPDKVTHQSKDTKIKPLVSNSFTEAETYLGDKYLFRFNTVSMEFEYQEHGEIEFKAVNENELFRELQKVNIKLSPAYLLALLRSDFVIKYDPFREYFNNLPKWDGTDYINDLASFIDAKDNKAFKNHFKKHLVRTVRCAIDDNFYNKQALILVHNEQNSGKSTFCRFLCPPALKNYLGEDITEDKDSRILLAKCFIINLDELSSLSKKDINSLKSLFSKQQINDRLPYERKNTILPRRCSFVGSTNQTEFLNDETGTVRWLCFEINGINWEYSQKINIDLVYSQAYHLFKESNFEYNLSKNEILENEERNKGFQILTVERELIQKFFLPDHAKEKVNFKTATDIIIRLDSLTEKAVKLNRQAVGKALTQLTYPKGRNHLGQYGYFLKDNLMCDE